MLTSPLFEAVEQYFPFVRETNSDLTCIKPQEENKEDNLKIDTTGVLFSVLYFQTKFKNKELGFNKLFSNATGL